MKVRTTEDFIRKAEEIHCGKYDYSKVKYISTNTKVCIICPKHGEFWQTPKMHLKGQGCPRCAKNRKLTQEDFILKATEIHGHKYDYSMVEYKSIMDKVCIICPKHGEFWQTPNSHLNNKEECPKCAHRSYKKTTDEFVSEARLKHGDRYDYSKVIYERENDKVCIICPKHGEFWQTPKLHLNGGNCPKCANEKKGKKKRLSIDVFISKAKEIHGDKYDYSKVEYVNTDTKVCIICPIHGEFWQTPHNHIGQRQGCPKCSKSHMEIEISKLLDENGIEYEEQKKFEWLKYKKKLSLDFYLPKYNVSIECQGEQHFTKFRYRNETDEKLQERMIRDRIKNELCNEHGIKIFYYSNSYVKEGIYNDANNLLNNIKKCEQ